MLQELHSHSEVQLPVKEIIDLDSAEEEPAPSPKRKRLSGVNHDTNANEQRKILARGKSPMKDSTAISLLSDDEEELEQKATSSQPIQSLLSDEEDEEPKSSQRPSPTIQLKSPKTTGSSEKQNVATKEESPRIEQQKATQDNVELPKPKHRRFGSEEPVVEIPSSDPIDNNDIEESEESDSDNEAPEEVGTREVAEEAKNAVRAAAKAVEQYVQSSLALSFKTNTFAGYELLNGRQDRSDI